MAMENERLAAIREMIQRVQEASFGKQDLSYLIIDTDQDLGHSLLVEAVDGNYNKALKLAKSALQPHESDASSGTCGFCGYGDGWLGEQGDETTQTLLSGIKHPDGNFSPHPNSHGFLKQYVTWCGGCVGGLKHKYQHYDDINLYAKFSTQNLRLQIDGIRWAVSDIVHNIELDEKTRQEAEQLADDPGVHLEKLRIQRDVTDMQNERFRRAGFDLTTQGWRP